MLGLGGKSVIMQRVDSKTICTNKRCDRDVGHQMATFCCTGVAVHKRLAITSISSRTGCCLYRLLRQCSDWGGKSVIMQRSTHKTFVPTTDVTVTLGIRWELFVTLALRCKKRLAVTSLSSRTGYCLYRLLHQYSDRGGKSVMQRVDSKIICTNKRCDHDVRVSDGNFFLHWR